MCAVFAPPRAWKRVHFWRRLVEDVQHKSTFQLADWLIDGCSLRVRNGCWAVARKSRVAAVTRRVIAASRLAAVGTSKYLACIGEAQRRYTSLAPCTTQSAVAAAAAIVVVCRRTSLTCISAMTSVTPVCPPLSCNVSKLNIFISSCGYWPHYNITKSPAVAKIADHTLGCQWPSRSMIFILFQSQCATSYQWSIVI